MSRGDGESDEERGAVKERHEGPPSLSRVILREPTKCAFPHTHHSRPSNEIAPSNQTSTWKILSCSDDDKAGRTSYSLTLKQRDRDGIEAMRARREARMVSACSSCTNKSAHFVTGQAKELEESDMETSK
ncbi:hypothetical protein ATANTOWER_027391, partial [Ataeniobius toweri]|nr:hypothetical protein [Ataeniobius toweri]